MPEPLVPLDGDGDVGVRDVGVYLLEDAAGFGGAARGAEVVVFVVGEVGACGGGWGC